MKALRRIIIAFLFVVPAFAAEDVVTAVHGTIEKIDSGTKTVVVKTDDRTRHSLHVLDKTAVHGADATAAASKDSLRGLKEGGEVVVYYTKRGTADTAIEIDRVGKGGLKTTDGAVRKIDRGGKKLVVATGDGTEETFRLTEHASKDAGEDVAKGAVKGSRVTVFYTEDAGKKIAHFFKAS
jgi:hypothetical protein